MFKTLFHLNAVTRIPLAWHQRSLIVCVCVFSFFSRQVKYIFRGERTRSREDFSLRMYRDEVQTWAEEFNASRHRTVEMLDQLRHRERPNSHLSDSLQDLEPVFDSPMALVINQAPEPSSSNIWERGHFLAFRGDGKGAKGSGGAFLCGGSFFFFFNF